MTQTRTKVSDRCVTRRTSYASLVPPTQDYFSTLLLRWVSYGFRACTYLLPKLEAPSNLWTTGADSHDYPLSQFQGRERERVKLLVYSILALLSGFWRESGRQFRLIQDAPGFCLRSDEKLTLENVSFKISNFKLVYIVILSCAEKPLSCEARRCFDSRTWLLDLLLISMINV